MYDTHQKMKRTMESDDDDQKLRMSNTTAAIKVNDADDGDDDVTLPGFRFHPTDEELVGFYLRRKVEKKPFSIELIKQIDIYKYDPWDLPKASNVGDKEWYFFCKRGRKYRNSIRPNRVTGSGFWKATGIDRPIYSGGGEGRDCIGLKKSLVYYRGSAGKGTKTDWMMHEFRLPADHDITTTKHLAVKPVTQEAAEVWTLCRIFKRNVSYRKCMPDFKDFPSKRTTKPVDSDSQTCSFDSTEGRENYISFNSASPLMMDATRLRNDTKPFAISSTGQVPNITMNNEHFSSNFASYETPLNTSYPCIPASVELPDFFGKHAADWDELSSVVEFRTASPFLM